MNKKLKRIMYLFVFVLFSFINISGIKADCVGEKYLPDLIFQDTCTNIGSITADITYTAAESHLVRVAPHNASANLYVVVLGTDETSSVKCKITDNQKECYLDVEDLVTEGANASYTVTVYAYAYKGNKVISSGYKTFTSNLHLFVPRLLKVKNTTEGIEITFRDLNYIRNGDEKSRTDIYVNDEATSLGGYFDRKETTVIYKDVEIGKEYEIYLVATWPEGMNPSGVDSEAQSHKEKITYDIAYLDKRQAFFANNLALCTNGKLEIKKDRYSIGYGKLNIPDYIKDIDYTLTSDDTSVVTVSNDGMIFARKVGTTFVRLKSDNYFNQPSCKIVVIDSPPKVPTSYTNSSDCKSLGSIGFEQNGFNVYVKVGTCNSDKVTQYEVLKDGKSIGKFKAYQMAVYQNMKVNISEDEMGKPIKYQVKALDANGKVLGSSVSSSFTAEKGKYLIKVTYGCASVSRPKYSQIMPDVYESHKQASNACTKKFPICKNNDKNCTYYFGGNCAVTKCIVVDKDGKEVSSGNDGSSGGGSGGGFGSSPSTCPLNQVSVSVDGGAPVCVSILEGSKIYVNAQDFCTKTNLCTANGNSVFRKVYKDDDDYFTLLTDKLSPETTSISTKALLKLSKENAYLKYVLKTIGAENNITIKNDVLYISGSYISTQLGCKVTGDEKNFLIDSDDYNAKFFKDNRLTIVYNDNLTGKNITKEYELSYDKTNKTYEIELSKAEAQNIEYISNWSFKEDTVKYINKIASEITEDTYVMKLLLIDEMEAGGGTTVPGYMKIKINLK